MFFQRKPIAIFVLLLFGSGVLVSAALAQTMHFEYHVRYEIHEAFYAHCGSQPESVWLDGRVNEVVDVHYTDTGYSILSHYNMHGQAIGMDSGRRYVIHTIGNWTGRADYEAMDEGFTRISRHMVLANGRAADYILVERAVYHMVNGRLVKSDSYYSAECREPGQ